MEPNEGMVHAELARLEDRLRSIEYGRVSIELVVHAGAISRIVRSESVSTRPLTPRGGQS
jgi:hypothetical protein